MALMRGFVAVAVVMTFVAAPVVFAQESQQTYRQKDPGVVVPVVLKSVNPIYPDEARAKRIQGVVELEALVLEDGTVGEVTVTKSLDRTYGLDDAAVAAMRQWVFKPGQKDGKNVRVLVTVEMTFALK